MNTQQLITAMLSLEFAKESEKIRLRFEENVSFRDDRADCSDLAEDYKAKMLELISRFKTRYRDACHFEAELTKTKK
jgi:hypothetical protein